jgi:hypothetical protein
MGLAIVLNKKTASPNGKLTFGLKRKIPSDIIYGRKKKRIQKQTMNEVFLNKLPRSVTSNRLICWMAYKHKRKA